MHGWVLCEDGRWYHPVVAETVLEAWINKLLKRLSSGHGNARKYSLAFDPSAIIRDVRMASEMLERLDPKSEVLRRPAVMKARAGVPLGPDLLPLGSENVPSGSHRDRKVREGKIPPNPPGGASFDPMDWKGPDQVRQVVVSAGLGGYLVYFTYRDLPERALVTYSPTIHAKLKGCQEALRAEGVKLVMEKGRAA
jgi:hypothetical protein